MPENGTLAMNKLETKLRAIFGDDYEKYIDDFQEFRDGRFDVWRFNSPVKLPPPDHQSFLAAERNNDFPVVIYGPRKATKPISNILIVVCGFNEPSFAAKLYFNEDYGMGTIASSLMDDLLIVFLPLPFHYWRMPRNSPFAENSPATLVYEKPLRLYLAYRQLMGELGELADHLRKSATFLDWEINALLSIHMLGFSLGGLGVIAALLSSSMRHQRRFQSCTLLFSGGFLGSFDYRLTGLDSNAVQRINNYFYSGEYQNDLIEVIGSIDDDELRLYHIFENRVLGPPREGNKSTVLHKSFESKLVEIDDRVLFITGSEDDICKPIEVMQSFPPSAGIHNLVVKGVGHQAWRSLVWKEGGAKRAAREMVDHMKRCGKKSNRK